MMPQDPYLTERGVLRNILGITDAETLQIAEMRITIPRMASLAEHPLPGAFDRAHLCAIHRVANAQTLFQRLADERHLQGIDVEAFCRRAAFYLDEINALHPFREGNGRAQRTFLSQLAWATGRWLSWELVTPDRMIEASIVSLIKGDHQGFEQILRIACSNP